MLNEVPVLDAVDDATLRWPEDLGPALATGAPLDDRALLDPAYRAALVRPVARPLAELAAALRDRLRHPPFFVVLRGLSYDPGHRVLAALASAIGRPVQPYPEPGFRVIRTLRPAASSTAPGWGVLTEALHTDSTNWPEPHDVTVMQCERPDQGGGGDSLILPLPDAVVTLADRLGRPAVERLRDEPVPWAVDPGLDGGVVTAPVLSAAGIRWQLFRNTEAAARGADLPAEQAALLGRVDAALHDARSLRRFRLERHDLLLMNNRAVLHARTAVATPDSERCMVHCKVDDADVRPDLTAVLPVGPAA